MGDTQIITGEVTGKREANDGKLVDVLVRMKNQRGEETLKATATVALPAQPGSAVMFPPVPRDLQQRALDMFARHCALSDAGA
jgi:hypothetical protein